MRPSISIKRVAVFVLVGGLDILAPVLSAASGSGDLLSTDRQRFLEALRADEAVRSGSAEVCWHEDADPRVVAAFTAALNSVQTDKSILNNRWTQTAMDGALGGLGDPITLTSPT